MHTGLVVGVVGSLGDVLEVSDVFEEVPALVGGEEWPRGGHIAVGDTLQPCLLFLAEAFQMCVCMLWCVCVCVCVWKRRKDLSAPMDKTDSHKGSL